MNKFWKHYLIYVIIMLLIILVTSAVFYFFLNSYEQGRSTYLAESIVNNINNNKYDEIIKYISQEEYTSEDYYKSILNQYNNVAYEKKMGVYKDDKPVYSITSDDIEIAEVTLKPSDKKGSFNINRWVYDKIELSIPKEEITIIIPHGIDLFINGNKVDDKYLIDNKYYPSNIKNVLRHVDVESFNKYVIKDVYKNSFITLSKGNLIKKDNAYTYDFGSNEVLLSELHDYLQDLCYAYNRYVSNEHKFDKVTPYLLTNTPTYSFLYGVKNTNRWSWNHTPTEFSNFKLQNMQVYNDNMFSVEASYDYKYMVYEVYETRSYSASSILLMVKKDGKWLLGDLIT